MGTVEQIERAIERLSADELAEFRAWFAAYDAGAWDHNLDSDVQDGRLDQLANEALKERECTSL